MKNSKIEFSFFGVVGCNDNGKGLIISKAYFENTFEQVELSCAKLRANDFV